MYRTVIVYELRKRGLTASQEVSLPVVYEDVTLDKGFRVDILVNDIVIVEIKSAEAVSPQDKKQLITYLRLADKRLVLLINFGALKIKDGISRLVNGLKD